MRKLKLTLATAAMAAVAITGFATSASAQPWDARHDAVRCDAQGDRCVVLNCDRDGTDCVRMREFHRDADKAWLHDYGFAPDYQPNTVDHYIYYGGFHVHCDADGDHCRRVPD
jgi:hypothetical protein